MTKQKELKTEDIKKINDDFDSLICDDCKQRTSTFFKSHMHWIMLKPKKLQLKMASLLCVNCKNKALNKMHRG